MRHHSFQFFTQRGTVRQGLQEVRAEQHEQNCWRDRLDRRSAGHVFQQSDLADEIAVADHRQPVRCAVDEFADLQLAASDQMDLVAVVTADE